MEKTRNRVYLLIIILFIIAISIGGVFLFTRGRTGRPAADSTASQQTESTVQTTAADNSPAN